MTTTPLQRLACAKRELDMRKKVYPSRVGRGSMKQETADYEIAAMEDIIDVLAAIAQHAEPQRDFLFGRGINPETVGRWETSRE